MKCVKIYMVGPKDHWVNIDTLTPEQQESLDFTIVEDDVEMTLFNLCKALGVAVKAEFLDDPIAIQTSIPRSGAMLTLSKITKKGGFIKTYCYGEILDEDYEPTHSSIADNLTLDHVFKTSRKVQDAYLRFDSYLLGIKPTPNPARSSNEQLTFNACQI